MSHGHPAHALRRGACGGTAGTLTCSSKASRKSGMVFLETPASHYDTWAGSPCYMLPTRCPRLLPRTPESEKLMRRSITPVVPAFSYSQFLNTVRKPLPPVHELAQSRRFRPWWKLRGKGTVFQVRLGTCRETGAGDYPNPVSPSPSFRLFPPFPHPSPTP